MLQSKLDPWKNYHSESLNSKDSGSKVQAAGSGTPAQAPRHAQGAQAPSEALANASPSPTSPVATNASENPATKNDGGNGGKLLPHVDGPSRQQRRSPPASPSPTPAAAGSKAPTRGGAGGVATSATPGLKPSLKAGIPRTVRATGRPADIEPLAVHSPVLPSRTSKGAATSGSGGGGASLPAQSQRSPSPDLMPRRSAKSSASSISPASSVPALPKLSSTASGAAASSAPSPRTAAVASRGSGSRLSGGGSRSSAALSSTLSATGPSPIATVTVTATGTTTITAKGSTPRGAATAAAGGAAASAETAVQRPAALNTLQALREEAAGLLSAAGIATATAVDRAGGSAPALTGGNGQGPNGSRGSRGNMPFMPMFMLPGIGGSGSQPGSPLRGLLNSNGKPNRSPGKGRPRRPKRAPGSQQQGSARLNLSSRTGRRIPDPSGSFEVITTAPGVIGEVRFSPEVWCMDLWQLLEGGCDQQRVWTFGTPAISNAAAAAAQILAATGGVQAGAAGGGIGGTRGSASGEAGGRRSSSPGAAIGGGSNVTDGYTSPQPLALLNGVVFRAVAAGSHHAVAISSEGFLYLWGSDSRGQLGRGWPSAQHVASYSLPREVQPPIEASLEDLQAALPVSLVQGIIASNTPRQSSRRLMLLDDGDGDGNAGGGGESGAGGGGGNATATATAAVGRGEGGKGVGGAGSRVGSSGPAGPINLFPMPGVHSPGSGCGGIGGVSSRSRLPSAASSYSSSFRGGADSRVLAAAASSVTSGLAVPGAATAAIMAAAAAAVAAESGAAATSTPATGTVAIDPDGEFDELDSPVGGGQRFTSPGEMPQQLQVYRLKIGVTVRAVACGALHTLVALEGGGVMGWGDNASGQATGRPGSPAVRISTPTRIPDFEQLEVVCISAGLLHSAAVTSTGSVWCWGSNRHGRLGIGAATATSLLDHPAFAAAFQAKPPGRTYHHPDRDPLPNTAAMLAHAHHSPDGLHDDVKQGLTFPPTPAKLHPGVTALAVACGYRHTLAVDAEGGVWAWGSNATQTLGVPDFVDRAAPVRVPGLPPCSFVAAATVSAALCGEGQLYLWGSDSYLNPWVHRNRVGGPQGTAMTPRSASLPLIHRVRWLGASRFRSVSLGARHAVAVSSYSNMYWWGDEDMLPTSMQYGSSRIVVKPPEPSDFLAIHSPAEHSGDGSVPPPPPPPSEPLSPTSYYSGSSSLPNRLSAFRVFNYRPMGRFSEAGGTNNGGLDSAPVSFSGGLGPTAAASGSPPGLSHCGSSLMAYLGISSAAGRDDNDKYGIVVRLCVFNGRVYMSIAPRRPTQLVLGSAGGSMSFTSRPTSVLGARLTEGGVAAAAAAAAMPGIASVAGGGVRGGSADAGSMTTGSVVGNSPIVNGDEQPVLVACGEGHTVVLCGQTRHHTTLEETRNAMMLMLRQYARHWHAVRRAAQARLVGGSPARVRARSPDRRPSSGRSTRSMYGMNRVHIASLQEAYRDPFPYIELDEPPADARDELCTLDMLLVFCRQAGLIDNISEYNDVIELYRVQLTNKHARIPPSMKQAVAQAGTPCLPLRPGDFSNNPTGPINMLAVRLHPPVPEPSVSGARASPRAADSDGRPSGRVGFGGSFTTCSPSAANSFSRPEPPQLLGPSRLGGGSGGVAAFASRVLGTPIGVGGSQPTTPLTCSANGGGGGGAGGGSGVAGGGGGGVGSLGRGRDSLLGMVQEESTGSVGGGGSRLGTPGTPPSLRVVDVRAYMPRTDKDDLSGPDERLQDADVVDLLMGLMQNRQVASSNSNTPHLAAPALLQQLALHYFTKLKKTCATPLPWVLGQVIRTEMLRALDSGPNSLTLHQAYIFLTSEHSAPQDLHLSMQDMRLGLAQLEQPFTVPLLRLAQFIRQSGLLPRLMSRIITHLHRVAEFYLDRLAVVDQVPWWWPVEVLHARRAAVNSTAVSSSLYQRSDVFAMWQQPDACNLLGLETIAGVVYDFDILGVYYGTTRKALRNQLTSEEQLALEHAKRDRLLAYVLAFVIGQYLVPLDRPWDMRPENVLSSPVSYPQFVEILAACLSIKAATQTPTGAVLSSVQLLPTLGDTLQHLPAMLEAVGLWREKILYPWKFNRVKHNDVELQRQVDRAFSLYCTIDPLAQTLGINIYQFTQLIRDTDMADKTLTMERIQLVFAAVAMVRVRSVPALRSRVISKGPDDNLEWTGLTAAQIIRLSTSQFAYTVAQHKLEEHLTLREKAMAAWKPRQLGGAGAGPGGGGSGAVSLAMALREAAQRTAAEVDEREAGILRPGAASASHHGSPLRSSGLGGRLVTQSSSLLQPNASGGGATGDGTGSLLASSLPSGVQAAIAQATSLPNAVNVNLASSSAFVSKLRRPGARRSTRPRDLAGLLRNRRPSGGGLVSFAAPLDDTPPGHERSSTHVGSISSAGTGMIRPLPLISQDGSYAALHVGSTVDGGSGGCGSTDVLTQEDELDLRMSWPSFTTDQFADSDVDSAAGVETSGGSATGSRQVSPNRGRSPPHGLHRLRGGTAGGTGQGTSTGGGSGSGGGASRGASRGDGGGGDEPTTVISLSGLPHPALELALAQTASGGGGDGISDEPSSRPSQSYSQVADIFRTLKTPEGPLPLPPPPPPEGGLTDESDREAGGGGSGGGGFAGAAAEAAAAIGTSPRHGDSSGGGAAAGGGAAPGGGFCRIPHGRMLRRGRSTLSGVPVAFGSGTARRTFLDAAAAAAADDADGGRGRGWRSSPGRSASSGGGGDGSAEGRQGLSYNRLQPSRRGRLDDPLSTADGSDYSSGSSPDRPRSRLMVRSMSGGPLHRGPPSPLGPGGGSGSLMMIQHSDSGRPVSRGSIRSRGSARSRMSGLDVLPESVGSPPRSPHSQRPDSADSNSVIGSVNRLVLTKHALATTGSGKSAKKLTAQPGKLLTREQFSEVIQRLAVIKYSKISSPMAAWRLLIERHVLPVVETRSTKFDRYLEEMMGPSIMSLVLAWEPQLKALFRIYGKDESKQTTGRPPGSLRPATSGRSRGRSLSRARSNSPSRPSTAKSPRARSPGGKSASSSRQGSGSDSPDGGRSSFNRITMSFVQFLQLCQDRKIIPALIQPAGLEEIFRRVNFIDGVESYIRNMAYPQFVDAVCLTAMTIYHHPRYKEQAMTVEDMLETFFSQLCALKRARTKATNMGGMESAAAAAAAAARGAGAVENPYAQWWSLRFEAAAPEPGEHVPDWSYLSSSDYAPVLLQDLVVPPPPVPDQIARMLARAAVLHNRGDCPAALSEYDKAAAAWRAAMSGGGHLPLGASLTLTPEQEIYLCLVRASVLMSCGRDNSALLLYDTAEQHLSRLPQGHPAEPLLHGCRGHLLYHMGRLQDAFERLVHAKVLREQHPDMGSHHVDTALAHHNLACCLDRLGKTHLALRLLAGAVETFRVVLGGSHPRTLTAARNMGHMQHRLFKLDLRYRSVAQEQADAEHNAILAALHRAASRNHRGRRPGVDSLYTLSAPRLVARREQANAALAAAAAAAAMLVPRRLEPLKMPAKERLAAFQLRVHGGGGRASGTSGDAYGMLISSEAATGSASYSRGRNGVKYFRSRHDMDYLGGGLHKAHPEVVATYEALKADIAAHATGAVHSHVPEGVVVVQRGSGGAGAGDAGGHRRGGAGGGGGVRSGPAASTAAGPAGAASRQNAAEEVPGPMRAFRGGVYDRTLAPRKLKVERRYGLLPPPPPAPPPPETPGRERGLQMRRANVLAAAMLEELNARLTGYTHQPTLTMVDRLADVLTGLPASPQGPRPKSGRTAGAGGGGWGLGGSGSERARAGDDGDTSSRRSGRSRPTSP